jgi:hypothetical protein
MDSALSNKYGRMRVLKLTRSAALKHEVSSRSLTMRLRLMRFKSLNATEPPAELTNGLAGLWWDAKGDLETLDGMAVHAYQHRKGGHTSNADYWYPRAGRRFRRPTLDAEWLALVEGLLSGTRLAGTPERRG